MSGPRSSDLAEIVVVYNPKAGGVDVARLRRLLGAHFAGRVVDLCECSDAEDMAERLSPWLEAGVHLVIAAGGDGTISDVASVLANSNVPLGILPMGTGNVVARELELPLDANEAAKLLAGHFVIRRLDVLRANNKAYLLAVSVGLGATAMKETTIKEKKKFGQTAYFLPFLRNFFGTKVIEFQVQVDGQQQQIRATDALAVNIGIIGYKALSWGPDVRADDGRMNLCYLRAHSGLDYLWAMINFLNRRYIRNKRLNCVPVKKSIHFLGPEGLPVQADGDWIGHTPIEVKLEPAALKVAVASKK